MKSFDAILFDFDGVLADTEPLHHTCWAEALRPLGIDLTWEFYRDRCIGIPDRAILTLLADLSTPPCDAERLHEAYLAKRVLFRERAAASPPFPEGLASLLDRLRSTYRMALVSSTGRSEIEPALAAGGLTECFEALVCGREAGMMKPAPEPYLRAAALLGARRPLVVEDSAAGIASGRAAGFEVLAVRRPEEVLELLPVRLGEG